MNIVLTKPSEKYKDSFISTVEEFVKAKDPFFFYYPDYLKYSENKNLLENDFSDYILKPLENEAEGINLKEGFVPTQTLWLVDKDNNNFIGDFKIRPKLTQRWLGYGGHIGYGISPTERRKGYGTKGLNLALDYCKDLGLSEVLLSLDARNEASYRIILGIMAINKGRYGHMCKLKDGSDFGGHPYYPENKNNIGLNFWLNTSKPK